MKTVFVLFALAVITTGSLAQNSGKLEKGEQCLKTEECINDSRKLQCINNYCGCRKGERQEEESHPDGTSVFTCTEVVGKGCSTNEECTIDLDNSKCVDRICSCKKEDGCITRKKKGEECQTNEECINDARRMKCVNYHCGCKKGQRQQLKIGGNPSDFECINVVGSGCTRNDECHVDLDKATCNQESQTCECKKENGCNGASTMAIISFLPLVFLSLGLVKSW